SLDEPKRPTARKREPDVDSDAAAEDEPRPRRGTREPAPARGRSSKALLWIIAGVVLVAGIGVGAFFWLEKPGASSGAPKGAGLVDDEVQVIQPRARFNMGLAGADKKDLRIHRLFLSADGSRLAVSNMIGAKKQLLHLWDLTGAAKRLDEWDGAVEALS